MMQIPDPVHGYIELDGMFADIVNTPEFQRLRSVEQAASAPSIPAPGTTGLPIPWAPIIWPRSSWSISLRI